MEATDFIFWHTRGFPSGSVVKYLPANAGDTGSLPELGRSSGGGNYTQENIHMHTHTHTHTHTCVLTSQSSVVSNPAAPWIVAHQASLSIGFFRQEYWSGLPFPPPGDLPNPGIEFTSPVFPALAGGFFTTVPPGKPPYTCVCVCVHLYVHTHIHSPVHCSHPRSVHGILQARILKWMAIPFPRESSWPRDQTHISQVSCTEGRFFTCWATGKDTHTHVLFPYRSLQDTEYSPLCCTTGPCCFLCHVFYVSAQFSRSAVSDSLRPHGLQHARPPCPSSTPGACSNSCPSGRWCHPTISSSVVPFSSCLHSFPASGSFPMSRLFACIFYLQQCWYVNPPPAHHRTFFDRLLK